MSIHNTSWRRLESDVVYENKHWKVRRDMVKRPDGTEAEYDVVVSPDAVNIVAITEEHELYLVGQLRYTTGEFSWEVPGGGSDGEDPLAAAKRELQEETGLRASNWKALGKYQSANGLMSEYTHVYLATGLTQTSHNEQAEEGITDMQKVPMEQAFRMIQDGHITHSQSIVSITKAALDLGIIAG